MTYIPEISNNIEKIKSEINSIVWPHQEKDLQDSLLILCKNMKKTLDSMTLELEGQKIAVTKQILSEATTLENIMYNRGRLVQIKKIIS